MPKSHTRNHRILPSKSVNARRAVDHNRKLNVVDHNQFVIRSLKSVNTKTPQAKHSVNHTKKVWKATRNHNVNTTKTAWRPTGKVVGSLIANLVIERLVPRGYLVFLNAKALSKGRTVADSIAERLTRPTAYKFKTDCSIIPVWCVSIRTSGLEIGETLGNLILRLLEETVVRDGKPVKKVLLMNLSVTVQYSYVIIDLTESELL
ncbi:hypothetical protein Tco_0539568 [Tanacetum coccineum]